MYPGNIHLVIEFMKVFEEQTHILSVEIYGTKAPSLLEQRPSSMQFY